MAALVAAETGKSRKDARGEIGAAIEMGYFVAGEGRRFYGRTTTSAIPQPQAMTVRQPLGVAGADHRRQHADRQRRLEGVSRAPVRQRGGAEAARGHAARRARRSPGWRSEAGLPAGVLNVVQGSARRRARRSWKHPSVAVVSFTGSTAVGPLDRAGRGRAAGEGVPRARRQESAGRLRRRRPRGRGARPPCCPRSPTPASAARPAAASSCSTRSTTSSASAARRRARELQASGPATSDDFGPVINERQLLGCWPRSSAARARGRHRARRRRAPHRPGARRRLLHGAHAARGRRPGRRRSRAPSCSGRSPCSTGCADFERGARASPTTRPTGSPPRSRPRASTARGVRSRMRVRRGVGQRRRPTAPSRTCRSAG